MSLLRLLFIWWTERLQIASLFAFICYYSCLFFSYLFLQGKGIYVDQISSQVKTVTMLFIILLPSAIFPTLPMELMCSGNSAIIPRFFLYASVCWTHHFVLECSFSQCILLHICQLLTLSTILLLMIWHSDDFLQPPIYDMYTTRKFCCPSAFPVNMLNSESSCGSPFIMQFHCSLPLSFHLSPSLREKSPLAPIIVCGF